VKAVCATLDEAGFEAFTVGGGVRDTLLGRAAGDWDVTTSAHPNDVEKLFRKVLPTGIEHGTVTVMIGRGHNREAIEVTAFRGEGDYTDGRRPDTVHFGVPLDEDLARRDFVINAIAYDPVAGRIHDSMGGVDDLERRVIRAVGEPERRFAEDGLRIMRAVRFAATLEFELEAATEAAIPGGIPSLEKVSRERVHVEMSKLMAAPRPSLGLRVAIRTGVIASILPELAVRPDSAWPAVLDLVDRADRDPVLRHTVLMLGGDPQLRPSPEQVETACRRLKWSNDDRRRAAKLARFARPELWRGLSESELRRQLAAVDRASIGDLLAALEVLGPDPCAAIRVVAERGDALAIAELAIAGRDLIAELGVQPGPQVGEILRTLLDEVLAEPGHNRREWLLQRARRELDPG
ncbi:MAG: hypothetical protein KJO07_03275, partial [Deltaproteobacteria bacterium]|nr:hypothetical protein [Deltaproteobacteria bacterium]